MFNDINLNAVYEGINQYLSFFFFVHNMKKEEERKIHIMFVFVLCERCKMLRNGDILSVYARASSVEQRSTCTHFAQHQNAAKEPKSEI